MGVLTLLCGFFFFFPVIALIAVLAAVALLAGMIAGTASLIGGLVTYLAAAQFSWGSAQVLRALPGRRSS
jgi:hypothetical protein